MNSSSFIKHCLTIVKDGNEDGRVEELQEAFDYLTKEVLKNGDKIENAYEIFFYHEMLMMDHLNNGNGNGNDTVKQQEIPKEIQTKENDKFVKSVKKIILSYSTISATSSNTNSAGNGTKDNDKIVKLMNSLWSFLTITTGFNTPVEVRKIIVRDLTEVLVKSLSNDTYVAHVLPVLKHLSIHNDASLMLMLLGVVTVLLDILKRHPLEISRDAIAVLGNLVMTPELRPLVAQQLLEDHTLAKRVISFTKADSLPHAAFAAKIISFLMVEPNYREAFIGMRALERLEDFANRNPAEVVRNAPIVGPKAILRFKQLLGQQQDPPFAFCWYCARFSNEDINVSPDTDLVCEALRGYFATDLRALALCSTTTRIRELCAMTLKNIADREWLTMNSLESLLIRAGITNDTASVAKHFAKEDVDHLLLLSRDISDEDVKIIIDRIAKGGDKILSRVGNASKLTSFLIKLRKELHNCLDNHKFILAPQLSASSSSAPKSQSQPFPATPSNFEPEDEPEDVEIPPPRTTASSSSSSSSSAAAAAAAAASNSESLSTSTTTVGFKKPPLFKSQSSKRMITDHSRDVFISYSWFNKPSAKKVRSYLEMAGFSCWMDESALAGGDNLFDLIDEGITNTRVVVACISNKYGESENCRREMGLATDRGKLIIPVLVAETSPWPPRGPCGPLMAGRLYIDLSSEDKLQERIQQLIDALRQIINDAQSNSVH